MTAEPLRSPAILRVRVDGHRVSDIVDPDVLTGSAQGQLKTIVERIERLEEDKAAVTADLQEVYAEAKGNGFDAKTLRKVVRWRKEDTARRQEADALLDLYLIAVGETR